MRKNSFRKEIYAGFGAGHTVGLTAHQQAKVFQLKIGRLHSFLRVQEEAAKSRADIHLKRAQLLVELNADLGKHFETTAERRAWLHRPNKEIGDVRPIERVVSGDVVDLAQVVAIAKSDSYDRKE